MVMKEEIRTAGNIARILKLSITVVVIVIGVIVVILLWADLMNLWFSQGRALVMIQT
jgi:hypothetical protein